MEGDWGSVVIWSGMGVLSFENRKTQRSSHLQATVTVKQSACSDFYSTEFCNEPPCLQLCWQEQGRFSSFSIPGLAGLLNNLSLVVKKLHGNLKRLIYTGRFWPMMLHLKCKILHLLTWPWGKVKETFYIALLMFSFCKPKVFTSLLMQREIFSSYHDPWQQFGELWKHLHCIYQPLT